MSKKVVKEKVKEGTSLVVQWLRPPNAGGWGSSPGQRTRPHTPKLRDPAYHHEEQRPRAPQLTPGEPNQYLFFFFKVRNRNFNRFKR